ncbi:MAG: lytic murein transglycosylase [Mesorhizobium sp.]|nr:MAG: lytic murein transglycosylase [Mesorhizobium sp.]TIO58304.1 MAG: lytic murein transglycosylase [Mesorhizobium sp.]TJV60977.1 MAG: lytic murein transglycosylase [Mesorhizobium sp.]
MTVGTERSSRGAPLCPAGHLPLKGGDWTSLRLSPIADVEHWAPSAKWPISPLEGEMSGRTEGGASR